MSNTEQGGKFIKIKIMYGAREPCTRGQTFEKRSIKKIERRLWRHSHEPMNQVRYHTKWLRTSSIFLRSSLLLPRFFATCFILAPLHPPPTTFFFCVSASFMRQHAHRGFSRVADYHPKNDVRCCGAWIPRYGGSIYFEVPDCGRLLYHKKLTLRYYCWGGWPRTVNATNLRNLHREDGLFEMMHSAWKTKLYCCTEYGMTTHLVFPGSYVFPHEDLVGERGVRRRESFVRWNCFWNFFAPVRSLHYFLSYKD